MDRTQKVVPGDRATETVGATPRVEFFFAPGSRYSYLAASQMALLEAETGCTIDWRPVNGGDIRKLRRSDPFQGEPVSGQYDWSYRERDARLWADYYGIRFREPPGHRVDFRLVARAAVAAKRLGRAAEYGWRICQAVYGSDTWPIDERVCIALAEEAGLAADAFWTTFADPETERILASTAEEAFRRGAFGVPTFFVGAEMFWGNDRLTILKHVLKNWSSRTGPTSNDR